MEKKKEVLDILQTLVRAFLAGVCIALGGTVFLRLKGAFSGSDVVGALFFTIGLFAICTRGYDLYTGKACYIFGQKLSYFWKLLLIILGNFLGCLFVAGVLQLTGICGEQGINVTAKTLVEAKMMQTPVSLIILGFFCNIFIYLAVDGFKNNPHQLGKYLALFLGVAIFILSGTEHSIADMYYWLVSGVFFTDFWTSLSCIILIIFGNFLGAIFIPGLERVVKYNIARTK